MTPVIRLTQPTRTLLRALLATPEQETYGWRLRTTTGLHTPTICGILDRLETHGWITSRWEKHTPGRPPRRYYRLTLDGAEQARAVLNERRRTLDQLTADSLPTYDQSAQP
ncbi:PadR family transcriptional regulator [Micrococcus luteus]|uniref:PadR family transcriptional regulator n=1 Tax=Micrococcus luteus TaxID=1270 RepID=UPI00331BCD53